MYFIGDISLPICYSLMWQRGNYKGAKEAKSMGKTMGEILSFTLYTRRFPSNFHYFKYHAI